MRYFSMRKITKTSLKKALKNNIYLSDYKVIRDSENRLEVAYHYFTVEFSIHGEQQQYLSFYVNGSITYVMCEQLIGIMNDLEGIVRG